MEPFSNLTKNDGVVWQRVDDSVIVIHLRSNEIYSLNVTAARFWELLEDGREITEIRSILQSEFEITDDELDTEIAALVQSLVSANLVHGNHRG